MTVPSSADTAGTVPLHRNLEDEMLITQFTGSSWNSFGSLRGLLSSGAPVPPKTMRFSHRRPKQASPQRCRAPERTPTTRFFEVHPLALRTRRPRVLLLFSMKQGFRGWFLQLSVLAAFMALVGITAGIVTLLDARMYNRGYRTAGRRPKAEIIGSTTSSETVFGNTTSTPHQRVLRVAGHDIPVLIGKPSQNAHEEVTSSLHSNLKGGEEQRKPKEFNGSIPIQSDPPTSLNGATIFLSNVAESSLPVSPVKVQSKKAAEPLKTALNAIRMKIKNRLKRKHEDFSY